MKALEQEAARREVENWERLAFDRALEVQRLREALAAARVEMARLRRALRRAIRRTNGSGRQP